MCYQVIELYAACRCPYYEHAIDRCASYGRHAIQRRVILVGYACNDHAQYSSATPDYAEPAYSDSGYHSGRSHKKSSSSRHQYR